MSAEVHAVTGAFGYSGKYLARRLLAKGARVITLTNSPDRQNEFGGRVSAHPLCFDDPDRLARQLEGVDVLHNTYWVRFNDRHFTHGQAVRNTQCLFAAARRAGVRRIVHVSITNPRPACGLEYFEGKAQLERDLVASGVPSSILRPTVLFGREAILINNIAWALRRFPIFGLLGDGCYRLQPTHDPKHPDHSGIARARGHRGCANPLRSNLARIDSIGDLIYETNIQSTARSPTCGMAQAGEPFRETRSAIPTLQRCCRTDCSRSDIPTEAFSAPPSSLGSIRDRSLGPYIQHGGYR